MDEKQQVEETEEVTKAPPPPRFIVTNVVRRQSSRLRRAAAPGKPRFKQFVGGQRLLRKQRMFLTPQRFEELQHELYEKVMAGAIEITAPDGTLLRCDARGRLVAKNGSSLTTLGEKPVVKADKTEKVEKTEKVDPPKSEKKDEPPKDETKKDEPPKDEPPKAESKTEPDDLTTLPGIASGRAKKLHSQGITTFKQLSEMSPDRLAELLNMTTDQAADICDAASEMGEV